MISVSEARFGCGFAAWPGSRNSNLLVSLNQGPSGMEAVTGLLQRGESRLSVVSHGVRRHWRVARGTGAGFVVGARRTGRGAYVRAPTGHRDEAAGAELLAGIWCDSGRMRRRLVWFSTGCRAGARCSAGVAGAPLGGCRFRARGGAGSSPPATERLDAVPGGRLTFPAGEPGSAR